MFQSDKTLERQLFAFTHRDLVADDSDVWLYCDLFDQLDMLDFDSAYVSQGQAAKEPKLLLRTIFFALTHGVISGRRLQDACRNDNRYIVLSGDTRPDRRTFDRFIKRHSKAIDSLFVQIVRLAQEIGLVTLGRVAIDGSKFKSFAAKSMRYDSMTRAMSHISDELEKLKTDLAKANSDSPSNESGHLEGEIKNQETRRNLIGAAMARIEQDNAALSIKENQKKKRLPKTSKRLHDFDSLTLGASAKFPYGYNVQAAVDDKSQIIIAADIHPNQSDQGALKPMLDQIAGNCGKQAEKILADCGYNSLENLKIVEKAGAEAIIPIESEYKNIPNQPCEQIFKGEGDREYFCLAGKNLPLASREKSGRLSFKKPSGFCEGCEYANQCTLKKTSLLVFGTIRTGTF